MSELRTLSIMLRKYGWLCLRSESSWLFAGYNEKARETQRLNQRISTSSTMMIRYHCQAPAANYQAVLANSRARLARSTA